MAAGWHDRHGVAGLALQHHCLRQAFAGLVAGLRRARGRNRARMFHDTVGDSAIAEIALDGGCDGHGTPPYMTTLSRRPEGPFAVGAASMKRVRPLACRTCENFTPAP